MSKNDNILDATDKELAPRTCPECGYQFSFLAFLRRYAIKFGFPKWTCPRCHQWIKYNYTKSNLLNALIFLLTALFCFGLSYGLGWRLPSFAFLFPYFVIMLVVLYFDKLERY